MKEVKSFRSESILVVDDNVKNLQVLGEFLQIEGLHVEFARDGLAAIDWIEKARFELILLDIMMPGMNGFEVCIEIKKKPKSSEIPIIFITAQTDIESIIKGFEVGAVDYITKPFIQSELLVRVKTQLNIKRSKEQISNYMLQIEERNKNINDSIAYAQYIQNAVLRISENYFNQIPEHFILYLPKDILSGDFYWVHAVKEFVIVALIDCTGHGIPGALMSMLGVTYLNEIVNIESTYDPGIILNKLREKIVRALGQKGIIDEIHDGMDASIIVINKNKKMLQYSGANNSLFLIRAQKLQIIKGNKMAVGYSENMIAFTTCTIALEANDAIYLYSDGFPDQFGGENGKKFKISSFKQLIMEIHIKPMAEQHEILKKQFEDYKGKLEQVDDVTVVGIKISHQ